MTPAERMAKTKQIKKKKAGKQVEKRTRVPVWETTLLDIRMSLGLTQRDVSNGTGVSGPQIHLIEHGLCDPTLKTALAIAGFFGKNVREIWLKDLCITTEDQ